MKTVQDLLGGFAQHSDTLKFTNKETGEKMPQIIFGVTLVEAPFRLVTKDQCAKVIGIVTKEMLNHTNDGGEQVYRFQGNGWSPEAQIGDILLQDVENPADRWACGPELFGGTGWKGTVQADDSITFTKAGKPLLAVEVPVGTTVESREGSQTAGEGYMLACTKANIGDWYLWSPDVVEKYVRNYKVAA